ncbi:MAG: winged helix-turn-helix domain-containing protein [Candidatus Caldarchaeum sp.]
MSYRLSGETAAKILSLLDEYMTVRQLAEKLGLSPYTVSLYIKSFISRGLVDTAYRRRQTLKPTNTKPL